MKKTRIDTVEQATKLKQTAQIIFLLITLSIAIFLIYLGITANQPGKTGWIGPKSYTRIISLAPSTTEILFALGLGDNVIGVSQFCNYPEQAKELPRMGGLMNPNYEAIVAAKPDLVIIFDDMQEAENKFKALEIETLVVKHDTINDILDAIHTIGERTGKAEQARLIVDDIVNKIHITQGQNQSANPPKVLVCIGHDYSQDPSAKLQNIYIAGNDGFYSEMIKLAGGQNAYTGSIANPAVSFESIIAMNPQIIIDILPPANVNIDTEIIKKQWQNFSDIDAVKNNRIYLFMEDYMSIPGPRFINIIEKFAQVINQPAQTQ
ncbi:MAG: helical backbone metal receptor [Sedimentisphaerales bacterium]